MLAFVFASLIALQDPFPVHGQANPQLSDAESVYFILDAEPYLTAMENPDSKVETDLLRRFKLLRKYALEDVQLGLIYCLERANNPETRRELLYTMDAAVDYLLDPPPGRSLYLRRGPSGEIRLKQLHLNGSSGPPLAPVSRFVRLRKNLTAP